MRVNAIKKAISGKQLRIKFDISLASLTVFIINTEHIYNTNHWNSSIIHNNVFT